MTKVVSGVVTVIIVGCLGLPVILASTILGGATGGCATTCLAPPAQPAEAVTGFDAEQIGIAATIVDIGVAEGAPRWGWVVALATAMQESGPRNLPNLGANNDHDSIGVFQQRPSQGWGTPEQLADPAYQAGKFYDKLLTIWGWQNMPLTQAAQTVQVGAYPGAYAKWTDAAVGLPEHLATTPPAVAAAILWALGQLGTTYSFGGDCTAPHAGDPARQCDCSSLMQQAYRAAGIEIPASPPTRSRPEPSTHPVPPTSGTPARPCCGAQLEVRKRSISMMAGRCATVPTWPLRGYSHSWARGSRSAVSANSSGL